VSLGGTDVDVDVQPSAAGQLGEGRAGGAGWTRDPRLGGSLVMRVLTSLVRRSTWPGHMMRRATRQHTASRTQRHPDTTKGLIRSNC
jgi:hypothetical protein